MIWANVEVRVQICGLRFGAHRVEGFFQFQVPLEGWAWPLKVIGGMLPCAVQGSNMKPLLFFPRFLGSQRMCGG